MGRQRVVNPALDTFESDDPVIKKDILQMIIQYLRDAGLHSSVQTLQDEAHAAVRDLTRSRRRFVRVKHAVILGDWREADRLLTKLLRDRGKSPALTSLQYALYKHQYLELIDRQEYQKALTFLNKFLKPLELTEAGQKLEFADLCYLLTCKRVQDASSFRDYPGMSQARQQLAERIERMADLEVLFDTEQHVEEIPPNRLVELLQQSIAYQIEFSPYNPDLRAKVSSLVRDYHSFIVPNVTQATLTGHSANVKCVDFVGDDGNLLVSGSGDHNLRLWDLSSESCVGVLTGHTSRIWDVQASTSGRIILSSSGDSSMRVWSVDHSSPENSKCVSVLRSEDTDDLYSLDISSSESHAVSGGYDGCVRLWDVETGAMVQSMDGHTASVSSVIFNQVGNLAVSGSKDTGIRFWDLLSGVCVKTFEDFLGEITSIEMSSSGVKLLSGSKDNSNRLWDIRMGRPVQRYKGHQNTFKNFVKCTFGPSEAVIIGGSEDTRLYVWDTESGKLSQTLVGHQDIVYAAKWSSKRSLLASASQDCTVKIWAYAPPSGP